MIEILANIAVVTVFALIPYLFVRQWRRRYNADRKVQP